MSCISIDFNQLFLHLSSETILIDYTFYPNFLFHELIWKKPIITDYN